MRVLITGADGFIGKNLQSFLRQDTEERFEIDKYTLDSTEEELENKIKNADAIVHLAGVNRPRVKEEFFHGNTDLTKKIVDLLNENQLEIPLIFSSSIQAALDNDYGKSKKAAEDYIINNYPGGIIFRLHNVFGKGCKPNYNSVVATFCNNIAKGEDITITDPEHEIELVYIDDVCQTFIDTLKRKTGIESKYNYIKPVKKIKLGKLAELIYSFNDVIDSISVPQTGDIFTKKLFSTFISYNSAERLVCDLEEHKDERGNFIELLHTGESGQFSVSVSKPGITRGNHYHHTKIEKFIVLKGEAMIRLRKIDDDKVYEIRASGDKIKAIIIPVGYTHNITNTGKDEMILGIWCNEVFDKSRPDTYYMEV